MISAWLLFPRLPGARNWPDPMWSRSPLPPPRSRKKPLSETSIAPKGTLMKNLLQVNNTYNDDKVIDACSIFGVMDKSGRRFSGDGVIKAIANMHDRGNGLGGGFAVYGLYPEHADRYALHLMYLSGKDKQDTAAILRESYIG